MDVTVPAPHCLKSFSRPLAANLFLKRLVQGSGQGRTRPTASTTDFSRLLVTADDGKTVAISLKRGLDPVPKKAETEMYIFDRNTNMFEELRKYPTLPPVIDELLSLVLQNQGLEQDSDIRPCDPTVLDIFDLQIKESENNIYRQLLRSVSTSCLLASSVLNKISNDIHVNTVALVRLMSRNVLSVISCCQHVSAMKDAVVPRKVWSVIMYKCSLYTRLIAEVPDSDESLFSQLSDAFTSLISSVAENQISGLQASMLDDIGMEEWSADNEFRRGKRISHGISYLVLSLATIIRDATVVGSGATALSIRYSLLVLSFAADVIFPSYYLSIKPSRTRHRQMLSDLHFALISLCQLAVDVEASAAKQQDQRWFERDLILAKLSEGVTALYFLSCPGEVVVDTARSLSCYQEEEGSVVVGSPPRSFAEFSSCVETNMPSVCFDPVPSLLSIVQFPSSVSSSICPVSKPEAPSPDLLHQLRIKVDPRWLARVLVRRYEMIGVDALGFPELTAEQLKTRTAIRSLLND